MAGDFYDHIGIGRANGEARGEALSLREVADVSGDERALRAARAAEILRDPVFIEAVEGLRAKLDTAWKRTRMEQADQRERAYLLLKALDGVVRELQSFATTGRFIQSISGRDPG